MRKIFFDTETTGLSPGNIAQLAAIIEHEDERLETKNYFFEIDYITDGAKEACGRDIDFYKEASHGTRFKDYSTELFELFSNATLIAHNEKFDENFLSTELWRLGIVFKPADKFCTMEYFKNILKIPGRGHYKYKNPSLSELVSHFNLDKDKIKSYSDKLFDDTSDYGFHDARFDTTSMFVVFQVYKEQMNNQSNWIDTFRKI